jgi:Asp-tRNA(Asn)/Glu-tRNA(Gln) amidotransferase A subunit family amidase
MSDLEICFLTATEMGRRLRTKDLSAREVVAAHLRQVGRTNPRVNALVTLVAEQAMVRAQEADDRLARGEVTGPLHGLPLAHKDLQDTAGIRTTYGSLIYRDHVPGRDSLLVERLRKAGAITLGKTNTPEFGAGSQTFNKVFGATLNPYDPSRTCGGSSGGAAASLACGMVPLADGSDEAFKAWRAWAFELKLAKDLERHRGQMKDTVVWNIEAGARLTGPQLGQAEVLRTQAYQRVREFLEGYEFLVLPVCQVLPFPVDQEYVTEIDGVPMGTYIDWMKSCYLLSAVGNPALAVPCAFTGDGLPVGLQIVGRHQDDWGVLQLGYAFEQATGLWRRRPPAAL